MTYSLVLVTPLTCAAQADAVLAALGWGEANFLVALCPAQGAAMTHRGLRATVTEHFLTRLATALEADAALAEAVLRDARPDAERLGHFDACLADWGLTRMAERAAD